MYEGVGLVNFVRVSVWPANVGVSQTGYEPRETNMYEIALETAGVKHAKKVRRRGHGRSEEGRGGGGQGCVHA